MNFDYYNQNKTAKKLFHILMIVMAVLSLLCGLSGVIEVVKLIASILVLVLTTALVNVLMSNKKDSLAVRFVMMGGFGIFYTGILFMNDIPIFYLSVFPAMMIATVFYDKKFSALTGIAATLVNILTIIYRYGIKDPTLEYHTGIIQIILIALGGVFCWIATSFIKQFNDDKMNVVTREEERQRENSERLMALAQEMSANIEESVIKIDNLKDSISATQSGMADINNGINDTTTAVQEQLRMTADIQNQIKFVTDTANAIGESISHSTNIIEDSMKIMETMLGDAKASEIAGNDVKESLEQLQNNTNSMKQIVSLINDVAEQTSLLALNASIEAARAGEAGRGFAVVAGEVNNLSVQTQSATTEISKLIDVIGVQVKNVVEKTEILLKNNAKQNESADATNLKLVEVQNCSKDIDSNSDRLSEAVSVLHNANAEIVNNISNVSSVSEEVSAQANVSYEEATKNLEVMDEVMEIIGKLSESAEELNSL